MFAVIAYRATWTNTALVASPWPGTSSARLNPAQALVRLGPGDTALARLDVRDTVDGVEEGLQHLGELSARGVAVLNPPAALLDAHDKLLSARALARAGLPHPETRLHLPGQALHALEPPLVVKPRFGSWGRGVTLCRTRQEVAHAFAGLARIPWFRSHGALVQELVPPQGYDLRVLVAGGRVVGAVERLAAPGEWRTNVALGGVRRPVDPPHEACRLALAAAAAMGADLVGVDLLPAGDGYVVLELNGAVDFTREYAPGRDVFAAVIGALVDVVASPVAAEALASA